MTATQTQTKVASWAIEMALYPDHTESVIKALDADGNLIPLDDAPRDVIEALRLPAGRAAGDLLLIAYGKTKARDVAKGDDDG